jgi:hypothetical protein
MGTPQKLGLFGEGVNGLAGISPHLILFAFPKLSGQTISQLWDLEIAGRSPFMRRIVNYGTGYALNNGKIVMHTQAERTKMEKKGGDRSDEERDLTSAGERKQ